MDESRLLTPAELQKLLIGMKAGEFYPNYIAKAQDTKTLKEVGEWLPKQVKPLMNKLFEKYPAANTATIVIYLVDELTSALKRGELPKE